MRAAFRYLAEFAKEVNGVGPESSGAYQLQFLGAVPAVSLADAWCDARPRSIQGKDYLASIAFRYTVGPLPPLALRLSRDDIPRFTDFLKSVKADFEMKVEAKNDFGQPLRGTLTVRGGLPCRLEVRADYDALAATVEVENVRRPGKKECRIPAAQMKDLGDELARYMLGVDEDFAKRL
jgi:hypothetical protein